MTTLPRKRPYMVVSYTRRPVAGAKTHIKGWAASGDEDVWDVSENVIFLDSVSHKVMTGADVVIDILPSIVVKNRYGDVADKTIIEGFLARYQQDVKQALLRWVKTSGGDMDVIRELAGLTKEEVEGNEPSKE